MLDLAAALAANSAGSHTPHTVVALPSYSVGESLLAHYGDRLVALEHRYLISLLLPHRLPAVDVVFISSLTPSAEVLDYYRTIGGAPDRAAARTFVVGLEDRSARCVAAKLLERPDLLDRIRRVIAGRPAVLEPWNVTEHEMAVAERLGIPVNGLDPSLRPLGFKSAGRRLFREAGVPLPRGTEDVRTVADVLDACVALQRVEDPPAAVVVKHDDSGAGDGNVVVPVRTPDGRAASPDVLHRTLEALPDWYLADLRNGGVVEELVTGEDVRSPSAQVDLLPDGETRLIATHDQVLGGDNGQVFLGCRFPAAAPYAPEIARHAEAVGRRLAAAGALGRAAVDVVTARQADGSWRTFALEINLRKGGTTHPFAALRNLVPGRYDAADGRWVADLDGLPRTYVCTDNLVDPDWWGLAPGRVIDAVRAADLSFEHRTGTGVLLHMLSGLDVDGRIGVIAIGRDHDHADHLFSRTREVVDALVRPLPG